MAIPKRCGLTCVMRKYIIINVTKQWHLMEKLVLGQGPERHAAITGHTEELQLFQHLIFLQECIGS